ncbi:MAG TPA: response regulator, partial [Burkholderiaceae bacterium]|nr:response regulator [Burkholderiaceae bacterium]
FDSGKASVPASTTAYWAGQAAQIADGRPRLSGLLDPENPQQRRVELALGVPAPQGGLRYIVGASMGAGHWQSLLEAAVGNTDGFVTLYDAGRRIIARSRSPQRLVGTELPAAAVAPTTGGAPGTVLVPSGEEGPAFLAGQVLHVGQWGVQAGMSAGPFQAAQSQALWRAVLVAALCLAIGLIAALWLSRKIGAALVRIARRDTSMPSSGPSSVAELEDLRVACAEATTVDQLARARMTRKAEEFESLFQCCPLGLAVTHDAACASVVSNPALKRLMGFEFIPAAADDSGSASGRLLVDGRPLEPDEHPLLRAAKLQEHVDAVEIELHRTGRAVRHVLVSAAPLHLTGKEPFGAIAVVSDITHLKSAPLSSAGGGQSGRHVASDERYADHTSPRCRPGIGLGADYLPTLKAGEPKRSRRSRDAFESTGTAVGLHQVELATAEDEPSGVASRQDAPVMVIGSDPATLTALRALLEDSGTEVMEAGSGPQALALLLRVAPPVAIVRIGAASVDGYEFARRSREAGYRGRLIALSDRDWDVDLEMSLAAGFEGHLTEPFDADGLKRLLTP